MILIRRSLEIKTIPTKFCYNISRLSSSHSEKTEQPEENEEFRVLNLRAVRNQPMRRRVFNKPEVMPPRTEQMAVDQNWGAVWPGPKSFNPATVPLPVRQGFTPKGMASPNKYANAELMKIPNFLHLTPPVVKKQCEALKQFCTPWPKGLETEEKIKQNFPMEIIYSDYCHGLPTIRNPLSRIVTIRLKLSNLELNKHAKDKFLRLVGERYDSETDVVTIVTDRCPTKKQNYDYGHYLLTALFHESWTTEPWEATKSEADMEYYDWLNNNSKVTSEAIVNWENPENNKKVDENYIKCVENLINEGENEYNISKYKNEVLKLLNLPQKQ